MLTVRSSARSLREKFRVFSELNIFSDMIFSNSTYLFSDIYLRCSI